TSEVKKAGSRYSVQVLVACSGETVQKALDNVSSSEVFILPVNYRGKSCYRICWGLYESQDRATAALHSLPEYFRQGGASPKVSPAAARLPWPSPPRGARAPSPPSLSPASPPPLRTRSRSPTAA